MVVRGRPVLCLYGFTLLAAIGSLAASGCQPAAAPVPAPTPVPAPVAVVPVSKKAAPAETWDVLFIQGSRVGRTRTRTAMTEKNGQSCIYTESESKLVLKRFGEQSEQSFQMSSLETTDGELIEFETQTAFGPTPVKTMGKVLPDDKLELSTVSGKSVNKSEIPWSSEYRGIFAGEQVLREQELAPGEERTFTALVPIINQTATVKLIGRGKEPTRMLDGLQHELMRIDSITTLPDGNEIASTTWIDDAGETVKTRTDAMQQETYRVTKKVAAGPIATSNFDLGTDAMVRLATPLNNPHDSKRVRYRVELDGGNPGSVFNDALSQSVKPISEHVAEVEVIGVRPNNPPGPQKSWDKSLRELQGIDTPNALIQSNDPLIIELAKDAAAKAAHASDPWEAALAMEKWVHDNITKKNFSQAFASASEVAKSREGDCTEHAVLLAAMLRAWDIPARVAIGLVYVETSQSFGFHMWTEAKIGDRWIPLDATLAKGGIGGGHLKLLDSTLNGASAYSSFLPVAQVLGRLKIEVLEVE